MTLVRVAQALDILLVHISTVLNQQPFSCPLISRTKLCAQSLPFVTINCILPTIPGRCFNYLTGTQCHMQYFFFIFTFIMLLFCLVLTFYVTNYTHFELGQQLTLSFTNHTFFELGQRPTLPCINHTHFELGQQLTLSCKVSLVMHTKKLDRWISSAFQQKIPVIRLSVLITRKSGKLPSGVCIYS